MTPKILDVYQEEYERKQQEEADMMDYSSWLSGLYVKDAITAAFKGKYPDNPYHVIEREEQEREENPNKANAKDFSNWAMAYNLANSKKDGEISAR